MTKSDASTQVETLAATLLDDCAVRLARCPRTFLLGVSGAPGSGKSTLADALVAQARRHRWTALALSLDDFYLPRRARAELASTCHPLLLTRGVPGTHDLALLDRVLQQLPAASPRHPVRVPRFDKGRDTRLPPSRWRTVVAPLRLLVLEGWCLGLQSQSPAQLARPVNALERDEDPDGQWRGWVNRRLRTYAPLWQHMDWRIVLQAPDWASVRRWRDQAEQARRRRGAPRAMDGAAIERFLQHYERLGRQALRSPPRAERLIRLDRHRHPV